MLVVTMRILTTAALSIMACATLFAQPPNSSCSTAALLCAGTPLSGTNTGAGGVPGFCAATDAMVWYTFTTNSMGGPVSVVVNGIDCAVLSGADNELSAVILSGNGSCTLTGFVAVSACELGDELIEVTSQSLLPETRYWILIAGAVNNGALTPAQCSFSVDISGPGADIIGVDLSAGPDIEIGSGESTQLQGISVSPLSWSPTVGLSGSDIPQPIASPSSTTVYTITSTIAGCTYNDDVLVVVTRRVNPPNTFTPNSDGWNDLWEIPEIADYPGAEIIIHDRWGQVVLRTTGYREAWDGTHNGAALPVGTYYYHIQLNQLEGRSPPYTGFVTIVR
jgi:gliding motility-associated-like protein